MKQKLLSNGLLLLIAMIWGFAFVAQVGGSESVGSLTFTGVRFAMGIIALLPVTLLLEKGRSEREERRRTVKGSLVAGIVLFCASILQQYGIALTASAGVAGFITGLYTVFIPIVSFLLFRKKAGGFVWLGALCALFGLFLLCYRVGEGFHFGLGELLLLIGSFFWTAHVLVVDRFGKSVRSLHFSVGQFSVCAVLGLAGMFLFEKPTVASLLDAGIPLLYCGVLSVGVAYTLQVVAQKKADPAVAAIVLSTESLFSAVGGALFGVDTISTLGYFGCGLMLAGIVLSQLGDLGKKDKTIE